MKKTYEAPTVERVEFKYRDQVVAASGLPCGSYYIKEGAYTGGYCENGNEHFEYRN